jgi:formylglycine-generating enzyme required for sulfatase activity
VCAMTIPGNQADPFMSDKPIRCVDWCDGEAFCRIARGSGNLGHLCYRTVSGGTVQPENQKAEWPSACSNSGNTTWPWGDMADGGVCNLDQQGCGSSGFSCGPASVQTFPSCKSASGIFDLIGNVSEWLGICGANNATSPDTPCMMAGGGYLDTLASVGCFNVEPSLAKSGRRPDVGFRCCYDLTPADRQQAGLP